MPVSKPHNGFTLLETLIALFMVSLVLTFTGLLFHRSFDILRVIDGKERTRQAARMGLDRITSELREAVKIIDTSSGQVEFEKIDPNATIVDPPPEPADNPAPPGYVAPVYGLAQAYPASSRLIVRYRTDTESLIREVQPGNGGSWTSQVVVSGVNSFTCTSEPDNEGEVLVEVAVLDSRRIITLSSRVLCPCIREEFQES